MERLLFILMVLISEPVSADETFIDIHGDTHTLFDETIIRLGGGELYFMFRTGDSVGEYDAHCGSKLLMQVRMMERDCIH